MDAYNIIKNSTLVDIYRCYELWSLIKQTQRVPGHAIEVGVWKGGTGGLIARQLSLCAPEKKIYLCDTFSGVVKASEKDTFYQGGEHADTSVDSVKQLMKSLAVDEQISILQGIFPEDTGPEVGHELFSFCHIDVDTYLSAKHVFDWISPRLSVNGVVVFDDCGTWGCEGVTDLVLEIANNPCYFLFYNINGHAVFLKLADSPHA